MQKKRIPPFDDPNEPGPGVLPNGNVNIVDFDPTTPGADMGHADMAVRIKDENERYFRDKAKS